MARLDQTPFPADIIDLIHDGRGVARRDNGKTVFIAGALPGERVMAQQVGRNRNFDEAVTLEVIEASAHRVAPRCQHFGTCGGCALQHLDEGQQILAKQRVLSENLQRIGHVTPDTLLPALTDLAWGYRRKGRFSVRRVEKKGRTLVGFRERDPRFVAELSVCHTVIPQIGERIGALAALVDGLEARDAIPQIEFIAGDSAPGNSAPDDGTAGDGTAGDGTAGEGACRPDHSGVALVFRHLQPLGDSDRAKLVEFAQAHGFAVFLQPGGTESVRALWPETPTLAFRLAPWNVELKFRPLDFIQVNAGLNTAMIARTLELLDLQPDDRVLDLFCGLGNFTLPMARVAREVVGVEGDAGLVARARANALHNALPNAKFHAADLAQDLRGEPWMRAGFDRLLLDPPRSGADVVLKQLPLKGLKRIVYVSCHPASLARDAGYLVNERGWKLRAAGVMDMFPHTAHVESIAMFEPGHA